MPFVAVDIAEANDEQVGWDLISLVVQYLVNFTMAVVSHVLKNAQQKAEDFKAA